MALGILLVVLVLQALLALIIVVVLRHSLGKELMSVALEQFETLRLQEDSAQLKEIAVVSFAPLDESVAARIKAIAAKRFNGTALKFSTDSALKGGMKIMLGTTVIDCSSKNRLDFLGREK
jgi:F0F1-type ATP synthase delta subunit